MSLREGAAASRLVSVSPERLLGWLARFAQRHGEPSYELGAEIVVLRAPNGALAECTVPFPPLLLPAAAASPLDPPAALAEHALRDRKVGVLLVRLGGFAVGTFTGSRLEESKVGSRHVQGRTAAGGWSQQRFARRRAGQAKVAYAAAADTAARLLLPVANTLDALVLGGDRRALAAVLEDARLAPLQALIIGPTLNIPDPRRHVLDAAPAMFRAVQIRVTDPPPDPSPPQ